MHIRMSAHLGSWLCWKNWEIQVDSMCKWTKYFVCACPRTTLQDNLFQIKSRYNINRLDSNPWPLSPQEDKASDNWCSNRLSHHGLVTQNPLSIHNYFSTWMLEVNLILHFVSAPNQLLSVPISFVTLSFSSVKLFYSQRLGRSQEVDLNLKMIAIIFPFIALQIIGK